MGEAWMFQDGRKRSEPFRRDILFTSLYEACKHRKTAITDATSLTDTVIKKLQADTYPIKPRTEVIKATQSVLAHFDKDALGVYKAYHPL